jgi:tetratricopeptide (TPR) repeat protein
VGRLDLINEIIDWHNELRRTRSGAEIIHAIEEKIERESDAVKVGHLNILLAQQHEALGNHAEAQEIWRRDPHYEIDRWHHDLVWNNKGRKITGMIEKRIEEESDPLLLRHLRLLLAMEHTSEGNYAAAEAIRLQEFEQDPDDPMPLISLAEQKLYYEEQPELGMPIIDRAIKVAYRSGIFRRHALAVKARIALQLGRYDVVEGVLRDIMELKFTPRNFDIGRERDILDRLPPESIDSEVARRYDEYCRVRKNPPAAG